MEIVSRVESLSNFRKEEAIFCTNYFGVLPSLSDWAGFKQYLNSYCWLVSYCTPKGLNFITMY